MRSEVWGPGVTPALLTLARARPDRTLVVVEVLGLVRTAAAIDPLVGWCADPDHNVRAAALEALGSIGLDDRTSAVALRALTDGDPQTRAMAARALGRGHRGEAVPQLARGLDDDWAPAAQAAAALRRLGAGGIAALESRALDEGQAGDLARQMLWRRQPVAAGE
jgi:HEAT repeat protein